MHSQTVFLVRGTTQYDENVFEDLPGEFRFNEEKGDAVAMGLQLEQLLDGLIWFEAMRPK